MSEIYDAHVSWEDVKAFYAETNGQEAADDVQRVAYEAAAHYANMMGYTEDHKSDVLLALDVLRLSFDGEFDRFYN